VRESFQLQLIHQDLKGFLLHLLSQPSNQLLQCLLLALTTPETNILLFTHHLTQVLLIFLIRCMFPDLVLKTQSTLHRWTTSTVKESRATTLEKKTEIRFSPRWTMRESSFSKTALTQSFSLGSDQVLPRIKLWSTFRLMMSLSSALKDL